MKYKRYKRKVKKKPLREVQKQSELQTMWEQRIGEAEQKKEQWKKIFRCDDLEWMYQGFQRPEEWPDDNDWFTINLMLASAKIMKRNVCPRELTVNLSLTRSMKSDPMAIEAMKGILRVREAVLQHIIKGQKVWKEGQDAYLNNLWQFGVMKVGYSADVESNPNAGKLVRDINGDIVFNEGVPEMEDDWRVTEESFFVDSIDPDNILVDRYCGCNPDKTGRFICEKVFRSVEDLQNDPMYEAKRVKDLEPSPLFPEEYEKINRTEYKAHWMYQTGQSLPENEIVVLYEIYDLRRREILTLARGAYDILRLPEDLPPGIDGHPYAFYKTIERRGEFYPVPSIFNWVGPQEEYGVARNQQALHRKRFNRKYIYRDGAFDEGELEKLEYGGDGTYAKANVDNAIEPIKDAPLDSAAFLDTNTLRNEFMEMTGIGQLQRSVTGAESATEAEIVEGRAREGEIDEHEEMMIFLSEIARKLHNLMEANLTQEGAVEHVGPQGSQWISFGPEHFEKIAGEVFFEVQASEATRMTLQVERAQMLQLMEVLGRNPMLALSPILLRETFDKFPAYRGNEQLMQEVHRIALLLMSAQQGGEGQQKQGNQNQTKQVGQTSTGEEASNARNVQTQ